ncbi:unnamed protein product, partial [Staurois parvus]
MHVKRCTLSAVSGHLLYYVCSLWSSPVLCLQSHLLVISCTMSAVSGHFLYYVCSLWSSAVSGHLLYVCSLWSSPVLSAVCSLCSHLWSSPVLCLQSLVRIFFSCFP